MSDIIFLLIDKHFNLLCKFSPGIGHTSRNLIQSVLTADILYNGIFNKLIHQLWIYLGH